MTQRTGQVHLLTVAEFAKVCRTTPRTIRFYEKKGLLKPIQIDPWNHYRYYDPVQAEEVFKIKLLQRFEMNLTEIQAISKRDDDKGVIYEKMLLLQNEIIEKQKQYDFLREMNDLLFQENFAKKVKREFIGPFTLFCREIPKGD